MRTLLFILLILGIISLVQASPFGYNNPTLPQIPQETTATTTITTGSSANISINGSSYNETYAAWAYNQTLYLINTYGANWYNHSQYIFDTYSKWFYNQTTGTFNQYGGMWYNHTFEANESVVGVYGKWFYNQTTDGSNYWATNGTAMYNGTVAQVGIGTISPDSRLEVYGVGANPSLSADTGIFKVSNDVTQELAFGAYRTSPYGMWLQVKRSSNDGNSYPLILNPLGSNVGIGTTNPRDKLEVSGNITANESVFGKATGENGVVEISTIGDMTGLSINTSSGSTKPAMYLITGSQEKVFQGAGDGDSVASISLNLNSIEMGSGSAARDVNLYRWKANFWVTNDSIVLPNMSIGTREPKAKLDVGGYIEPGDPLTGSTIVSVSDSVNGISGMRMKNNNTGTSADFRFIVEDTTGHYFAFSLPSVNNNVVNLLGMPRKTTAYIFNTGGTARDMAIGTLGAKSLVLGTSNAKRMEILSTGNINMSYNLSVSDSLGVKSANPKYAIEVGKTANALNVSNNLFANTTSVGINTTTATRPLEVNGAVNITGTNHLYIGAGEIYWDSGESRMVIRVN